MIIRLSVEQLHELQRAIQATGEVNATVLPKTAFSTDKLFVAWARSVNQEEFYLAVWRNEDSWKAASRASSVMDAGEFEYKVRDIISNDGGAKIIPEHGNWEQDNGSRRQGERENE